MKRAGKAELARRITIVSDLIAKKFRRSEIVEYCLNELEWPVSSQMVYSYIKRAKDQIVKMLEKSVEQNMAESVMDLKHLYRKALEAEKYNTALNIRKEMNRVLHVGELEYRPEGADGGREISEELENMISDLAPARRKLIKPGGGTAKANTPPKTDLNSA